MKFTVSLIEWYMWRNEIREILFKKKGVELHELEITVCKCNEIIEKEKERGERTYPFSLLIEPEFPEEEKNASGNNSGG